MSELSLEEANIKRPNRPVSHPDLHPQPWSASFKFDPSITVQDAQRMIESSGYKVVPRHGVYVVTPK